MQVSLLLWLSLWCATNAVATDSNCHFSSKSGTVPLFSIRAHSGKNVLTEYNNVKATHTLTKSSGIPDLFRSNLLNNLPSAVSIFCANRIVVEMRKAGKTVAKAEFNVTDSAGLDLHNWFSPSRLVQTYPFWTGKTGFADFGIKGHSRSIYSRDFYIHNSQGNCSLESGLMGIGESSNDPCSWVTNGGSPPVLFYAKEKGPYSNKSVVDYADQFVIYMRHLSGASKPDPFFIGPDKVLLFSIQARSGKSAKDEFLKKEVQDGLPATQEIPPLYRSGLLNNLTGALKEIKVNRMVVEMQKNGTAVARAEFYVGPDDRDGLDMESWFSPKRLVASHPFWVGSFMNLGIKGYSHRDSHGTDSRTFYIHQVNGGCSGDIGLMGISESSKDACKWVTNGGAVPVLFYAKKQGAYETDHTVGYADQFIVYLKYVSDLDSKFAHKKVFMCLKPEFIQNAPAEISSPDDCASHCVAQGRKCQGFRFKSQENGSKCQLFEFTKCSHDVNIASCNNTEWAYVRNQAGLPPGRLCPSSYGYRHGSSVYNPVPSATWSAGLSSCSSNLGLTKYADADDASEVAHMHGIKTALQQSLFIGGKMVDPVDYKQCSAGCNSTWKWVSCNKEVSPKTWHWNEPARMSSNHVCTTIWMGFEDGICSISDSWDGSPPNNHALCECVDPFVDSRLFTYRKVFMCLKPEFIQNAPAAIGSSDDCASHCIDQGSKCQGFRFQTQANGVKCQLFIFTKCSHDMNVASCNNTEWAYVRNQAGLPPGKLCPSSYGYRHGSSVYNIVDALNWHNASARCSSDLGLTKYADVSDVAESTHMHELRADKKQSFFIGGRMTSPVDYRTCGVGCNSTWEWVSCKTPIESNLWQRGQPNEINTGHVFVDIWKSYATGIGATLASWSKRGIIDQGLCECVDPFD